MGRLMQGLLWVGGLVVGLLMAYIVGLEIGAWEGRPADADADAFDVAVVYPDAGLWDEFRRGVALCRDRGLVASEVERGDALVVTTKTHRRPIRFRHVEARGLRETREEAQRLLRGAPAPLALVGSSNTVLTVALADALAATPVGPDGEPGAVLLIPWASAVLSPGREPGEVPAPLLTLAPGRMFRFCADNQSQADLLVASGRSGGTEARPRRALIVEDRDDPYSVDLAGCFRRAIEAAAPEAEIVSKALAPAQPASWPRLPPGLPGPADDDLADAILREAGGRPTGEATWVFLPIQDEPTRRLLRALHRRAGPDAPIRVFCGDAIGADDLAPLAVGGTFPVRALSSASASARGAGDDSAALVPAEIVAALAHCLDRPPGAAVDGGTLRKALAGLDLKADDPAALGRPLAFRRTGERAGDGLGEVLLTVPGRPGVFATAPGPGGAWSEPRPLDAGDRP